MFKNRKFTISSICIILVIMLIVGIQIKASANQRLEEYQKYCNENCELTKVSKQELSDTIEARESEAVSSIEEDATIIKETKSYLDSKELSDSEVKVYEAIAIGSEYDSEATYTTDELISLESDYNGVASQLKDLKTSYQMRVNKKSIKSYNESINESKDYLASVNLSTSEKKKYDSYNEDYKVIEYDAETDYTAKELESFKQSYKELDTNYSKLVKSVKARIKEQTEAEDQVQIDAGKQSTWSNDASYSSGTTSGNDSGSSSSKGEGTSSSSGSNDGGSSSSSSSNGGGTTEAMPDYCYSSEASAYSYGEANMDKYGGFGVYPGCAGNMSWWEIDWFEM